KQNPEVAIGGLPDHYCYGIRNVSTGRSEGSTRLGERIGRIWMFKLNRRSFVLSSAALAASTSLVGRAVSADSGSIRILMAGGDADLANTNNAIARFNKKFPNFQVSVDMDPISTGWGDFVTKVIGEF